MISAAIFSEAETGVIGEPQENGRLHFRLCKGYHKRTRLGGRPAAFSTRGSTRRLACIWGWGVVSSFLEVGNGFINLCGVRDTTALLKNRWSTRREPTICPALASP